jgi:hypothetical protein
MRTLLTSIVYCLLLWCPGAAETGRRAIDLKVSVNRTALYPGDRLEYVVRAEHDPSIEFVQDHVRKDQLNLDPFEILELSTTAGNLPAGRKFFELRLLLTTFDTGHPEVTIPSFNLFYFGHGDPQGKENAPAEMLAVPPLKIGLSSTLVDNDSGIRNSKPGLRISQLAWILPGLLGLCCLIAVAAYLIAVLLVWAKSGFWKRRMTEHMTRKSVRESLEEMREAPVDSAENVLRFYGRASEVLRGVAAERLGDCSGLTPDEMQAALLAAGDRESHAERLTRLMEQCDLVRYSPNGHGRGLDQRSEFLRKFEELAEER